MNKDFDKQQAKKNLENLSAMETESQEKERIALLKIVIDTLKSLFSNTKVEVYLVGSITQPYEFHSYSDVDVVLKNFKGDRFDLWTKLEGLIHRNIEVILFENCHFQEHVINKGYKVL